MSISSHVINRNNNHNISNSNLNRNISGNSNSNIASTQQRNQDAAVPESEAALGDQRQTDDGKDETGHNPKGFSFWMAGGGVKPGLTHGATDETGAKAVEGKVHFRDLHATILHLLGLPHDRLSFFHQGRLHRLTGPEGGKVVHDIIA